MNAPSGHTLAAMKRFTNRLVSESLTVSRAASLYSRSESMALAPTCCRLPAKDPRMKPTILPFDDRLSTLVAEGGDEICVTLGMPTHPTAPEREQDSIRFRNLLRGAEEALIERGMRRPVAKELLEPAQELLNEPEMWINQQHGLAVFLSRELAHYRKLPYEVPETLHVNSYFVVRHVLPLLTAHVRFLLLAVSQSEVRLFASRDDELTEIELPGAKFEELLRFIDTEKSLQHHTASVVAATRTHKAGLMFHGHGTDDPGKERAFEFFRLLDGRMRRILEGETAPMILVGEERVLTIFREASTYSHIAEMEIHGNPEHLNPHDLMQQAQRAMEPMIEERRVAGRRLFEAAKNGARASVDLEQVLLAAFTGKLEVLLANRSANVPGEYDESSQQLTIRGVARPDDNDLLELAMIRTLRHGGQVYVMDEAEMPGSIPAAGVLRKGLTA
jgi:hypothetical protein